MPTPNPKMSKCPPTNRNRDSTPAHRSKDTPPDQEIIYDPIQTWSRLPKPSTGEDGYFSQTLSTAVTIPSVRTFRLRTLSSSLPSTPPPWPSATVNPPPSVSPADLIMEIDLAAPGVCGHPETAHGGVLATVIDEGMSLAVLLYTRLSLEQDAGVDPKSESNGGRGGVSPRAGKMYTSQLDIRYKKPVAVPGTIEVHARVLARVGRKFWVRAQIVQDGAITTDAMAFWLLTEAAL